MNQRIRSILSNLDTLITDLRELSDDIWLNIDHNDSEAAKRGFNFKIKYNEVFLKLSDDANELRKVIKDFTKESPTEPEIKKSAKNQLVNEFGKQVPHSLEESFTYQRPVGFILEDTSFKNTTSWRQVYETICKYMADKNPILFQKLPDDSKFISNRGNKYFSRKSDDLRSSREFSDGIFAEINLSANQFRDSIKRLLQHFSIPNEEIKLFF